MRWVLISTIWCSIWYPALLQWLFALGWTVRAVPVGIRANGIPVYIRNSGFQWYALESSVYDHHLAVCFYRILTLDGFTGTCRWWYGGVFLSRRTRPAACHILFLHCAGCNSDLSLPCATLSLLRSNVQSSHFVFCRKQGSLCHTTSTIHSLQQRVCPRCLPQRRRRYGSNALLFPAKVFPCTFSGYGHIFQRTVGIPREWRRGTADLSCSPCTCIRNGTGSGYVFQFLTADKWTMGLFIISRSSSVSL